MTDPGDEQYDVTESDANPEGDMGVSSEREGDVGPGQKATTGVRDTSEAGAGGDEDTPPEQSAGGDEENPDGLTPKAGYSSKDPRSG